MSASSGKRKAAEAGLPELLARPSPHHPGVTLYGLDPATLAQLEAKIKLEESSASGLSEPAPATPARRSKVTKLDDSEETPARRSSPRKAKANGAKVKNVPVASSSKEAVDDITQATLQIKHEVDVEDVLGPSPSKAKTKKAAASPRKAKPIQMELAVPHPAPEHWREVYDTIHKMRDNLVAPVDTMGCHTPATKEEDPRTKRYVTLVALMLSSQTKDEVTHAAVMNLREALGGLTVDNILAADDTVISSAIAKVGFWRRKTEYLKKAAQKLRDEFDSDVPKTVDELCSLPGVGPKMAFLCLQSAWKLNVGIGVDTHVHRITNRLGWHKPPTTTPEQTRLNLQSWLPKELHYDVNHMLVGFGQTICLPVGPKCDVCELSAKKLCPSARVVAAKGKAKPKVEIAFED